MARELRAAFSGHLRFVNGDLGVALEDSVSGYVEWEDEVFLTMGPQATASVGVVLAHHLHPLDLVLDAAREAERLAKHRYGRNALVVTLLKRSGERLTAGTKWTYTANGSKPFDAVQLLMRVVRYLEEGTLSSRWPHIIASESFVLEGLCIEARQAELKRLIRRHLQPALSTSAEQDEIGALPVELTEWARCMRPSGFTEMTRWLLIGSFITRGDEV